MRLLEALCVCAGLCLALPAAVYAEEPARPAKHKPRKKRARAQKPKPEKPTERRERGPTALAAAQAAAATSSAQIVKDGDTSVKVMSFEGLGIEGRLRSPQLVYFVQRVQAEFARPVLPHRSFMPELHDTAAREPVR
ncbi:MAG TPA: hypothetical protein VFX59_03485 [Polyangiales bacterium]|nr:hypothetical protein [Polyangiales bacterium]